MKHTKKSIAKMIATRRLNKALALKELERPADHIPFERVVPAAPKADLDALGELIVAVWRRI